MPPQSDKQLPLPFSAALPSRTSAAAARQRERPRLFALTPQLDITLHSADEALAVATGAEADLALGWLAGLVGPTRPVKNRRVAFPAATLDRLVAVRPPAEVTLDASALAVCRALWARQLGLSPLKVELKDRRLVASSYRWPKGFAVHDAPWTAIVTLLRQKVPLEIDPKARRLMSSRLATTGEHVATAALAGSSVLIETSQPQMIESLELPALAYAGPAATGRYRMPLLAAEPLLRTPQIRLAGDLENAIKKATARPRPQRRPSDTFPWELYGFQARDAAEAERILRSSGGVLLAGDMGSGKTTVSLALAEKLGLWPLLVISPLAAFSTWQRQLTELGKNFLLATGAAEEIWGTLEQDSYDAVVVSYDRIHTFAEALERYGFSGAIADEIQRIKSPSSRRSRTLRHLAGVLPVRIGLSGTPLTNTIHDLLPLGAFLVPGQWPPRATSRDLSDLYVGEDPEEALAQHLSTLMVRRRMEDTGLNLPELRRLRSYVTLSYDQQRAIADLVAQAKADRESGELTTKMHAFVRLHRLRQIVASPGAAGVAGPNPKLEAALDLTEEFLAQGRKIVLFVADRAVYSQLTERLTRESIGWVGIWGSTPPAARSEAERRFHNDPEVKVFVGTIQAAGESLTLSPTATATVFLSYVYSAAALAQAEARIYRANATAGQVDVVYIHASAPGGTLDDRLVEILARKQALFSRIVDRAEHVDTTQATYSMDDLLYLLSGDAPTATSRSSMTASSDVGGLEMLSNTELELLDSEESLPIGEDGLKVDSSTVDMQASATRSRAASRRLREQAERDMFDDQARRKLNARTSAHRRKGTNRTSDEFFDDGVHAEVVSE